ncbi:peptidase inhibitor family I36 protein [Jiangella sp. DSM 45060]|uniref:peptidase inhibitor family I36 protein n=1 Tax=Jiangella sp. DSM 45060 TaxID=1798224 RepID=UPI000B8375A7|nr:peptidase inhibitor family I36 protein [Jiangella sp. DSM 45060]
MKKLKMLALAAVAATAATVAVAAPASAADQDNLCQSKELCLFWGSNYSGLYKDFYWNVRDFGNIRYPHYGVPGGGAGERVKNNAASAINWDYVTARVYYNENWTGPYDDVPPRGRRNLYHTWNDNASFRFLP